MKSWKKEGVDYKAEWNLYFNMARVCLTDTVVSEVLDSVGEAGLDDEIVAHLLTRSTCVLLLSPSHPLYLTYSNSEDKFQSAFVLGLLLEE